MQLGEYIEFMVAHYVRALLATITFPAWFHTPTCNIKPLNSMHIPTAEGKKHTD